VFKIIHGLVGLLSAPVQPHAARKSCRTKKTARHGVVLTTDISFLFGVNNLSFSNPKPVQSQTSARQTCALREHRCRWRRRRRQFGKWTRALSPASSSCSFEQPRAPQHASRSASRPSRSHQPQHSLPEPELHVLRLRILSTVMLALGTSSDQSATRRHRRGNLRQRRRNASWRALFSALAMKLAGASRAPAAGEVDVAVVMRARTASTRASWRASRSLMPAT
jgi:hypothetical protein